MQNLFRPTLNFLTSTIQFVAHPAKPQPVTARLTLDALLEKIDFTDKKLDLLDIDVEGADLKVLKGFNIEKFKPELICVEIHEKDIKNSEIYKYLSNFSYELVWSGVFSHIFRFKS